VPHIAIYEWKYFPFKAPRRKNYKDLDRQVESFLEEEQARYEAHQKETAPGVGFGDWVNFNLTIADQKSCALDYYQQQNFWFKIGDDEGESPMRDVFLGKKLSEAFCTTTEGLQSYFSSSLGTDYNFLITITDIVSHSYFCFEHFKRHFRIKTNKDMHQKLIEVFSYRNDISQRRAMVEEALKLLTSKHQIDIPSHLALRQQKMILEAVQEIPDYHVYRVQKDFNQRVRQLAEKQAREQLLIDQLAYHENITVSDHDVHGYLNLANRARTKEFIYFGLPAFKVLEQEVPASAAQIKRICLREKTINHAIYHLTKK
jgi:FKBP-type peptidyl-prolyl cis-trans isomerase (trigger factor)